MRNGQNNNKRMRGRNRGKSGGHHHHQNPLSRMYESNGPDVKIRGNASHIAEKYLQLARDAQSSGDPIAAENYYQHAEHYFRLIAAAQEQFRQNQPQPRTDNEMPSEDGDDDSESFSNFGAEPGFVPVQQQPFVPRDPQREQPRDTQPYQPREQYQQPRENNHQSREHNPREHRPQPQFQPQPQPQPVIPVGDGVDRLPSFITGPQPQVNGAAGFEPNGGERFPPRRRRRPHGPRPEGMPAPVTPGDDFNPGNE
jgi:hypothetical protein